MANVTNQYLWECSASFVLSIFLIITINCSVRSSVIFDSLWSIWSYGFDLSKVFAWNPANYTSKWIGGIKLAIKHAPMYSMISLQSTPKRSFLCVYDTKVYTTDRFSFSAPRPCLWLRNYTPSFARGYVACNSIRVSATHHLSKTVTISTTIFETASDNALNGFQSGWTSVVGDDSSPARLHLWGIVNSYSFIITSS